MNLENVWSPFILLLLKENQILHASKKIITGLPFLYITVDNSLSRHQLEKVIQKTAAKVMVGKMLNSETIFVRKDFDLFVYRHRFLVPQKKMFCCGNLCDDCTRLKPM